MKTIDFGDKLKEARENMGLTQRQLAAQLGMSKSTVSQYESKDRIPSPVVLMKICAILHVSADYLLGIDKIRRADLSGLNEKEIKLVEELIEVLRENGKK